MDRRLLDALSTGTPFEILARHFLSPEDYALLSTAALQSLDPREAPSGPDLSLMAEQALRGIEEGVPRLLERAGVAWAAGLSIEEAVGRGKRSRSHELWRRVEERHLARTTLPLLLLVLPVSPHCRPAMAVPVHVSMADHPGIEVLGLPESRDGADLAARVGELLARAGMRRRPGLTIRLDGFPRLPLSGRSWELPLLLAAWFVQAFGRLPPAHYAATGQFTSAGDLEPHAALGLAVKAQAAADVGRSVFFHPIAGDWTPPAGVRAVPLGGAVGTVLDRFLEESATHVPAEALESLARAVWEASRDYHPEPRVESLSRSMAPRLASATGDPRTARARLWLSVARGYRLRHDAKVDEAELKRQAAEKLYAELAARHELDVSWRTRMHEFRNGTVHLLVDQYDYAAAEELYQQVLADFEAPDSMFTREEIGRVWGTGALLYLAWSCSDPTKLSLAGDLAERSYAAIPAVEQHRNLNYVAMHRSLAGRYEESRELFRRNLNSLPEDGTDFLYSLWGAMANLARWGTRAGGIRALDEARALLARHEVARRLDPAHPYPGFLVLLHASRIEASCGDRAKAIEGFARVHQAFLRPAPHVDNTLAAVAALDLFLFADRKGGPDEAGQDWLATARQLLLETAAALPRTRSLLRETAAILADPVAPGAADRTEQIRRARDRFPC
ncbi:MAG: hypothetical protein HY720_02360 [Planctomycetes bacterium]|nr:hypothetical protein [Planctomycetota bacterium]